MATIRGAGISGRRRAMVVAMAAAAHRQARLIRTRKPRGQWGKQEEKNKRNGEASSHSIECMLHHFWCATLPRIKEPARVESGHRSFYSAVSQGKHPCLKEKYRSNLSQRWRTGA